MVSTHKGTFLATPGFIELAERHALPFERLYNIVTILTEHGPDAEPSWVVGDQDKPEPFDEDGGNTRHVPAPFRFWAIRDQDEDGSMIVTFLLPEEY